MPTLTKTVIDKFAPPATGYKLYWDDDVSGFGVRVTAGGKRTFFVQGRVLGKELRHTIGPCDSWSIKEARKQAQAIIVGMNSGTDPRDAKRATKAVQVTLQAVADEYMARPGKLKESSKGEIERHVRTTFADIKDKPVAQITEAYCIRRYNEMYTGGLHGNREDGAPGQANQSLAILKALLNYAIRRHKVITANPCFALRDSWNELQPRTSYIPATKIGACWNLLTRLQGQACGRAELSGIELVMFLLFTGCRLGEALELTWEHVNLEESWYHLPDPKNRRPIWLPLSSQAVEMLKSRPRVKNNPYVFAGKNAGSSLTIAPRELWEKISAVAGLELTSHDARRTFTTLGVTECKLDLYKIDLLIGHKPNSVVMKHYMDTQRLQWLKPEVQTWADWIENKAVIAKAVAAGNVLELRTQKAG